MWWDGNWSWAGWAALTTTPAGFWAMVICAVTASGAASQHGPVTPRTSDTCLEGGQPWAAGGDTG